MHVYVDAPSSEELISAITQQMHRQRSQLTLAQTAPVLIKALRERADTICSQITLNQKSQTTLRTLARMLDLFPSLKGRPTKYLIKAMSAYSALGLYDHLTPASLLIASKMVQEEYEQRALEAQLKRELALTETDLVTLLSPQTLSAEELSASLQQGSFAR